MGREQSGAVVAKVVVVVVVALLVVKLVQSDGLGIAHRECHVVGEAWENYTNPFAPCSRLHITAAASLDTRLDLRLLATAAAASCTILAPRQ